MRKAYSIVFERGLVQRQVFLTLQEARDLDLLALW